MKIVFKRLIAYFIDLLFIVTFVSMLSEIKFLNPNHDKQYQASKQYYDFSQEALEEDSNLLNNNKYQDLVYEIKKLSINSSLIELLCFILYFGGFQGWNKGQTLGKKLLKIKIVNKKNQQEADYKSLMIRTLVLFGLYAEFILIILMKLVSQNIYLEILICLNSLVLITYYVNLIMIIFRKDHRGLHEILSNTEVISIA